MPLRYWGGSARAVAFLALACALALDAQQAQTVTPITGNAPTVVYSFGGSQLQTGNTNRFYYVVVANFVGGSLPSNVVEVRNGPMAFNANSFVALQWQPVSGATTYDVLKLPSFSIPASGSIALATGLASTVRNYNDTGGSLSSYTMGAAPPNSTPYIVYNSRDYTPPALVVGGSPIGSGTGGGGATIAHTLNIISGDNNGNGIDSGIGTISCAGCAGLTLYPSGTQTIPASPPNAGGWIAPTSMTGQHVIQYPTTGATGSNQVLMTSGAESGGITPTQWGTGSGAVTVISNQTLSSPSATITINSIPQTGHILNVYIKGQSSYAGATSDPLIMQLNGDTGSSYTSTKLYGINSGSSGIYCGSWCNSLTTNPEAGNIGTTASGGGVGQLSIVFMSYADSTFAKSATILATYQTTGMNITFNSWLWSPGVNAGITSISLTLSSGANFVTGTNIVATIQ